MKIEDASNIEEEQRKKKKRKACKIFMEADNEAIEKTAWKVKGAPNIEEYTEEEVKEEEEKNANYLQKQISYWKDSMNSEGCFRHWSAHCLMWGL